MAIENHPKFNAWNEAFERRNRAEREYLEARMLGRSQGEIDAAELELDRALAAYKLIADNLDEGMMLRSPKGQRQGLGKY